MKKLALLALAAVLSFGFFGSAAANESAAANASEWDALGAIYAAPYVAFAENGPEWIDALAQQYAAPFREMAAEPASNDYLAQQYAAPFRQAAPEAASVDYLGQQYAAPYRNANSAAPVVDFIGLQYAEQYVDGLRESLQVAEQSADSFILAD